MNIEKQARKALRIQQKEGLQPKAIGERLKITTDEARKLLFVGRTLEWIEGSRLTANELLLMRTIAEVERLNLAEERFRSATSREVEYRARKYSGWCAATASKRLFGRKHACARKSPHPGLGFIHLAGNGYVGLTPAGWAMIHAMEAA